MPRSLIVEIFGNATQFGAELDKAAGKTRAMGKVAGVAGIALAGGLAFGLEKSVKAAEAAQVSQARLDNAFKTSGQSSQQFSGAIDKAESSARKLGFTNSDTRDSIGSLEIATHSGTKALADLGIAQDIARFKGTSLQAATKMLTMAQTGSQRALKQLGLTIQPVTTAMNALTAKYQAQTTAIKAQFPSTSKMTVAQKEQENALLTAAKATETMEKATAKASDTQATAAKVTALVSEKLHGQADAYSATAAGGAAQFKAQTDALMESLGKLLLPAITAVSAALASLAGFLTQHTTLAKILVSALGGLAVTLLAVSAATKIYEAGMVVARAAAVTWTAAQWLLNAALTANPIGLIIVALVALGVGLVEAYKHSQTFRDIVQAAFKDVKVAADVVMGGIKAMVGAFQDVVSWVRSNWPLIATLIAGPFAPLVALATNAFGIRSALLGAFGEVIGFFRAFPGKIVAALGDLSHLLYDIGASIMQGLLDGMTAMLGPLISLAHKIGNLIHLHKGPLDYDRKLLIPHGKALIQGLQDGMNMGMTGLLSTVGGYAPSIAANVGTSGAGGGGGTVNVTVNGWVGNDQQIAEKIRRELLKVGQRNGTIFGGVA